MIYQVQITVGRKPRWFSQWCVFWFNQTSTLDFEAEPRSETQLLAEIEKAVEVVIDKEQAKAKR